MSPVTVMTVIALLAAGALATTLGNVVENDRRHRAAYGVEVGRTVVSGPAPPQRTDAEGARAVARLEAPKPARKGREMKRCRRLLSREWRKHRRQTMRRSVDARDMRRIVRNLPRTCRRLLSRR